MIPDRCYIPSSVDSRLTDPGAQETVASGDDKLLCGGRHDGSLLEGESLGRKILSQE